MARWGSVALGVLLAGTVLPAAAQDRTDDNAVTQAEDGFGFSVGRESLGIYSAGNARGFSPTAAGNVRIEGLYFDPAIGLSSIIEDSTSIRVGLSAQGYPFTAPSGIVDQVLRRPDAKAGASILINGDSYGSYGIEIDGSLPLSKTLSLGYGVTGGRTAYPDGTDNWNHGQGLILRWRPAPGVEIMPFWTLYNDYNDEAGPFYVPAGNYLPPQPPRHQFDGPGWADFRFIGTNQGVLASYAPSKDWLVRLGAFRSVFDQRTSFANLLLGLQPDGTADRLIIADPRAKNVSLSGELRVTRSFVDGPRLHVLHLSLRERDARKPFGGSDEVDLGPARIGVPVVSPEPAFVFSQPSLDRVRQTTLGVAYDGRWKDVGEVSVSVSRAAYRKTTDLPGVPPIVSRSNPWLYNGTAAGYLSKAISVYAGYARGLEESGIAPPNAANRNQPLPAILTEQKDAGLRWNVTGNVKLIAGVFDLSKPYFGYNAASVYTQIGTIRSRGAEFSVSGNITKRLNVVAGGFFLDARVVRDPTALGNIGPRPAALPGHLINLNLNWRTPFVDGLSLDTSIVQRDRVPSTTDNLVSLPPRATVSLGGRYRFKLMDKSATFRLQMGNVFDNRGFNIAGPGIYGANNGRFITGYLAIDV
ncbi:TonB-dependent receptor [Sphingomonas sp.]|jgi:iron complex outermembrane receptor protein|uniref:TonB-dependent siderophore receptor n=1 Tax=Sphingomonas sp. TaxID=28214 RepID=UPI002E303D25|nr:TonB-dependent receptor [Sphingomonas sp.]HEX4694883.1 TonB-dependent receptor [Sphingomonas sp.]